MDGVGENQYYGFGNLRLLMDDHFSNHGRSSALMHIMGYDAEHLSGLKPEALSLPPPPPPPLQSMAGGTVLEDSGISVYQQGRWPRQETLTLLEIRSRLDPKFKESAQKAPLWDEVSRIMAEEHGYQRSGKKCREKIENLYKYYKKTKEGKTGRQDGRHYRFFRQLQALYGESSNAGNLAGDIEKTQFHFYPSEKTARATFVDPEAPNVDDRDVYKSLGLNSSSSDDEPGTSSDESDREENNDKGCSSTISWESKIKDFMNQQVKKFTEVQEVWMEKMMKSLERSEQERMLREEQWRRKETERLHREKEHWSNERAWIEARDLALLEVLGKVIAACPRQDQPTTIERKGNKNNQRKRKEINTEDYGDGIDEDEEEHEDDPTVQPSKSH